MPNEHPYPAREYLPFQLPGDDGRIFRRGTPGGLWLPEQTGAPARNTALAFFTRTYVSYSDVYGDELIFVDPFDSERLGQAFFVVDDDLAASSIISSDANNLVLAGEMQRQEGMDGITRKRDDAGVPDPEGGSVDHLP